MSTATDPTRRAPRNDEGWCPFAEAWPIPENETQPGITPYAAIAHSAAGRGSLYGWWLNGTSLESHFWISYLGTIEQYVRCNIRADANGQANRFQRAGTWVGAISIETESRVDATDRWTDDQAAALVRLLAWICRTYDLPAEVMVAPKADGLGWHVMFGAPGPWTPSAKTCPGAARIEQFKTEILPAVQRELAGTPAPNPTEEPLMVTPDDAKAIRAIIRDELDQSGLDRLTAAERKPGPMLWRLRNELALQGPRTKEAVIALRSIATGVRRLMADAATRDRGAVPDAAETVAAARLLDQVAAGDPVEAPDRAE